MLKRFSVLFFIVPIVELFLLIVIGTHIGALNTIMLVLFTGITGYLLARSEGIANLIKMRQSIEEGFLPELEIVRGGLILIGGLCLVIPGVITDIAGLVLLIPPVRNLIANKVFAGIQKQAARNRVYYRRIQY